jgi:DNA-binding Lrp family transcriptional regulator
VEWADDLAGPYDVIARVEASGLDELGRLVASRIQVVGGVTRTLTCMVIHR